MLYSFSFPSFHFLNQQSSLASLQITLPGYLGRETQLPFRKDFIDTFLFLVLTNRLYWVLFIRPSLFCLLFCPCTQFWTTVGPISTEWEVQVFCQTRRWKRLSSHCLVLNAGDSYPICRPLITKIHYNDDQALTILRGSRNKKYPTSAYVRGAFRSNSVPKHWSCLYWLRRAYSLS